MEDYYQQKIRKTAHHLPGQGKVSWSSPSNIALVKYWGKHDMQLPDNASLSMTLNHARSLVEMAFTRQSSGSLEVDFTFDGNPDHHFGKRIMEFFTLIKPWFPFLDELALSIHSKNTFPHSAGIASSASFMSALSLCVLSLERFEDQVYDESFYQKASWLSRLGSGSASRSVFPRLAAWGEHPFVDNSSDYYARNMDTVLHSEIAGLKDAVVVVNASPKKVSSSEGHALMNGHFYAENRIQQASSNMARLLDALYQNNWPVITEVVENEALSLHAMMLSSLPGYTLLQQETISVIERVRKYRADKKMDICFTLDAGPNVHVLYRARDSVVVKQFIESQLKPLAEDQMVIYDEMGEGPVLLEKNG
ncbi:MAG: hypothetical protein R6T91_02635 [Bacteroidales bacterium]